MSESLSPGIGLFNNIDCEEYYEYKKWIEKYKEKMPLLNRMFLEIHVGSWLSSVQNSYDMLSTGHSCPKAGNLSSYWKIIG